MRRMTQNEAMQEAIRRAGSRYKLARMIGITSQAVYQWDNHVPAARVLDVERATGVNRHNLDPIMYPRGEGA